MVLQLDGTVGKQLFICNATLNGWEQVNDESTLSAAVASNDSAIAAETAARQAADTLETNRATAAEGVLTSNRCEEHTSEIQSRHNDVCALPAANINEQ